MLHIKKVDLLSGQFPETDQYPFKINIFKSTKELPFTSNVTFFVGENGSGKSTLLEALAKKCNIYIWRGVERTRSTFNPHEKNLYKYINVEWTNGTVPGAYFSSQIFHGFAQLLDEWEADNPGQIDYFGGRSLLTQSHGQSIMSFFKARYKIKGLYLLDEPETALSPKTQIELLQLLTEINNMEHAQFIIATHSPILLSCPGSVIYSFDHSPVKAVRYEETEQFTVYKEFMDGIKNTASRN